MPYRSGDRGSSAISLFLILDGCASNMTLSPAVIATWRILDRGDVPEQGVNLVLYDCPGCGAEAELPVLGTPLAQIESGIVFDIGKRAMPRIIQCRNCRRRFELDQSSEAA